MGSDSERHVDVRLIAASNRHLQAEAAAERFRADPYHRLSVYPLTVPPLRERPDDILPLAGHFLSRDQGRLGLRGVRLNAGARRWLVQFDWPGNVRELEHALSRGVIRALSQGQRKDDVLELGVAHLDLERTPAAPQDLPIHGPELPAEEIALSDAVDDFRRRLIAQRLKQYDGNKAAAAKSLGMDRGNFHRLLKRLNVP